MSNIWKQPDPALFLSQHLAQTHSLSQLFLLSYILLFYSCQSYSQNWLLFVRVDARAGGTYTTRICFSNCKRKAKENDVCESGWLKAISWICLHPLSFQFLKKVK